MQRDKQALTHTPQDMHLLLLKTVLAVCLSKVKAPLGQNPIQAPQPVQRSSLRYMPREMSSTATPTLAKYPMPLS